MKHTQIPREDSDVLARKIADAVIARGGKISAIRLQSHPRGLILIATIFGQEVVVLCTSYSIVSFETLADSLMAEYQVGFNPAFPVDADIVGLHRDANLG